ncbi:restriction endonuclease subunit S [Amphibacillus sp. Q70]|uniref:restriction endonuclease subunit S n=1 Tax=Amphibacillus sp. Q70 TaxID=3453416 RepID=UPI003F86C1FD
MEEKKMVPKRRYQGFTEDWDKSKLENLASFSKGKGYSKKDLTDIGHQLILYGRLYTNYETVIKKVDTYTIKQENSMLSKGREVIVPSSGETKEDIARASVILEPNIIIGGDLNVIIPSKELDSVFLALNISNGSCQSELMKRAQGSSVVHLYNEDLISVTLYFPSVKEQQKIGEFFKVLDERIANQKRKIAKVKALKAAYLTEMFPQEGETVPKRRFKGYTEPWEQKKLCELGTTISGIGFPNVEQGGKEGVPFYKISDMNLLGNEIEMFKASNFVSQKQVKQKKWEPIKSIPAVIFAKVGAAIMMNRKRLINHTFLIDNNTMAYIFNDDWDTYFGKTLFDTLDLPKYAQVGALPSYNGTDIGGIDVIIPNQKEQQKIGEFFKNLDNQIETEEKKLDKLQKMKEAYLEEMFV